MRSCGQLVGVFVFCLLLAILLQVENRAYETGFGGHPDEAAHVVTSLMVRDFVAGGFLETPMPLAYAKDYAEAYPKVALGHYPPVFYVLEGLWLLPNPSARAVLVFSALLTAACGGLLFVVGKRMMPWPGALVAAVGLVLLPLSQKYTAIVMSDVLQVTLCLAAVMAFVRFAESGRKVWSLGFGALAALAILTKAAGILLVLVPPLWILLSGRWELLKTKALWLAPLPVLLLAAPWMAVTLGITQEGAQEVSMGAYVRESIPFYAGGLRRVFGVFLLFLAVFGGGISVTRRGGAALGVVVLGIAGLVFFVLVPSGLDDRYLLVLAPPILLLSALAGCWGWDRCQGWPRYAVLAFCFGGAWLSLDGLHCSDKFADGFSEAIAEIDRRDVGRSARVLASSDARGEGALIAEAAFVSETRPDGQVVVRRGSKWLADVKWLGQDFRLKMSDSEEVREGLLRKLDYVVLDGAIPPTRRRPDHDLIEQTVAAYPETFVRVAQVPSRRAKGRRGLLKIYHIHQEVDEPGA